MLAVVKWSIISAVLQLGQLGIVSRPRYFQWIFCSGAPPTEEVGVAVQGDHQVTTADTGDLQTISSLTAPLRSYGTGGSVSIVSNRSLSHVIILSASQFHIYLPWGQCLFNIMS